ncbi:hypothetical protein V8F20_012029 [Naviculisporaceae sp. PSN 640]
MISVVSFFSPSSSSHCASYSPPPSQHRIRIRKGHHSACSNHTLINKPDNAYIAAQKAGKSPALCAPASEFMLYYASCDSCIEVTSNGASRDSTEVYLDPKFHEFVEYCSVQTPRPLPATSEPIPITTLPAVNGTVITTLWATTTLTDGLVISLPLTATFVGLDKDAFISRLNSTTTAATSLSSVSALPVPSLSPIPDQSSSSQQPSTATIAGAAVGGLIGLVAIVFIAACYLRRRKTTKHKANTELQIDAGDNKAQLHGDSVLPKNPAQEMGTQANTAEMEGSYGPVYQYDESKGAYVLSSPGTVVQPHPAELYGSEILPVAVPVATENHGHGGLTSA